MSCGSFLQNIKKRTILNNSALWTKKESAVIASITEALIKTLVMILARGRRYSFFNFDACDNQVERVIFHKQEEKSNGLVSYCSLLTKEKSIHRPYRTETDWKIYET